MRCCRASVLVTTTRVRKALISFSLAWLVWMPACGGGSPTATAPQQSSGPTPTPTPSLGTVRLIGMSVPAGSTLIAQPMGLGQQVPELWGSLGITMVRDVPGGRIQFLLATPQRWCLGTGVAVVDFHANVETLLTTFNVSKAQTDPTGICALPYSTTTIEVHVYDSAGQELLVDRFPAPYNFIAP